jgi:two-component system, chemotaxis family, chemotaxis protein CheY
VVMMPRPFIKTATYFGPCRRRTSNPNYSGLERRGSGVSERIEPVRLQLGNR